MRPWMIVVLCKMMIVITMALITVLKCGYWIDDCGLAVLLVTASMADVAAF